MGPGVSRDALIRMASNVCKMDRALAVIIVDDALRR